MRGFIQEVRRRKVHRAALIYGVGGYAAVEAADLLSPLLGLPDWAPRLALGLVLAGFPLAIALAWVFQVTAEGVQRTPAATRASARDSTATGSSPEAPADDSRTAILVAPITDQGLGPGQEFIADGLTDEIITELSRIEALRVISRASAMRLKGMGAEVEAAARDLGIDFVLQGSVRRAGDELRVTLRLTHLETGESRWSEGYRGSLEDIFGIHDEAARSVADALALRVATRPAPSGDRGLDDPRAVESYLRARYETWKFSRGGLERAERHLLNGLEIVGPDPRLYASLGHAYSWYAQLGLDPDGAYLRKAEECAERVFELEPESSRAHWLIGMVRFQAGDLRAARAPLERSLLASPHDPDTLMMLGYLSALCGQLARARGLFEAAVDVDPLTPLNNAMPGFLAVLEGRPSEAVPYYRRYREMDPHSPFAVWCLLWAALYAGEVEEAEGALGELTAGHADSLFTPLGAGLLHGVRGEAEAARAAITDELRAAARGSELFSREVAHVLALSGEVDEALDWLENTIRIGNVNHPFWSQHDHWLRPLHGHPRFATLMEQVEREWRSLNPELAV